VGTLDFKGGGVKTKRICNNNLRRLARASGRAPAVTDKCKISVWSASVGATMAESATELALTLAEAATVLGGINNTQFCTLNLFPIFV